MSEGKTDTEMDHAPQGPISPINREGLWSPSGNPPGESTDSSVQTEDPEAEALQQLARSLGEQIVNGTPPISREKKASGFIALKAIGRAHSKKSRDTARLGTITSRQSSPRDHEKVH